MLFLECHKLFFTQLLEQPAETGIPDNIPPLLFGLQRITQRFMVQGNVCDARFTINIFDNRGIGQTFSG